MADQTFAFRARTPASIIGSVGGLLMAAGGLITLARAIAQGMGIERLAGTAAMEGAGLTVATASWSGRDAAARLTDDGVDVDFGWWWHHTIPYTAIERVELAHHSLLAGYGIRTDLRTWIALIWWGTEVVTLVLDPPRRLPLLPFIHLGQVRELRLGLDDPQGFRAALTDRLSSAPVPAQPAAGA